MRGFYSAAVLVAIGAQDVRAQSTDSANSVFAFGWSPAAGLIGIEWVNRSFSAAPRLGGAVGIGVAPPRCDSW